MMNAVISKSIEIVLVLLFLVFIIPNLSGQNCNIINPLEKGGIFWTVIVNKKNVPTYRNKECNILVPSRTLKLKSKYSVCDHGKNSIKINKDGDHVWVKKEDLLLTSRCLTTESGIAVKASVVSYYGTDSPDGTYYDSPSTEYGTMQNIGSVMWYDFYFVYDTYPRSAHNNVEESEYVLLGKKYKFTAGASPKGSQSANKVLFGWFKTSELMIWNTRMAFEPNLSKASVSEKTKNNVFAHIWKNKRDALMYSESSRHESEYVSNDKSLVNSGTVLGYSDYRFPTLEKKDEGITSYRIAFAGNLYGQRELGDEIKEAENIKNIDILFVVDATKTMIPHLKKLPSAITDAVLSISKDFGSDYNLNWKLAYFRNSIDQTNGKSFSYVGSTKDINLFRSWVNKLSGESSSTLLPEDMFYGTQSAIEKAFRGEKESVRIAYLISDVKGEERPKVKATPEYLGLLLKQKKVHFFALNIGYVMADEFKSQMLRTIQQANKYSGSFMFKSGTGFQQFSLSKKSGYSRLYIKLNSPTYVKQIVNNSIRQIVKNIDDEYQNKRYGTRTKSTVGNFKFDFKMDFGKEFEKLNFSNKAIGVRLYRGWVVNEHHKLKHSPFTPVILLSQEECYSLSNLTNALVDRINTTRPLEAVEKYLDELKKAHTGEFSLVEDLKSSIENIGGEIPLVSQLLSAYINGRIENIIPINDPDGLSKLQSDLSLKSDAIANIYSQMVNEKDKVFIIGEERYRWVNLSTLP